MKPVLICRVSGFKFFMTISVSVSSSLKERTNQVWLFTERAQPGIVHFRLMFPWLLIETDIDKCLTN